MGQKLTSVDVIGALSQNSNIVTLAPSVLTIGGQQYITGTLNTASLTLVASELYMVYAVVSGGVVSLITSTNVNSVGPAGYTSWKLVGAFVSGIFNLFGQFLEIDTIKPSFQYTLAKSATQTFVNNAYNFVDTWASVSPYYNPANGVHQLPISGVFSVTGRMTFGGITGTGNTINSNVYSILCVRNTIAAAPAPTGSNSFGDLNNPWYVSHEPVIYIGGNLVQANKGDFVWWAIASNLFTNNARILGANITVELKSLAKPIKDM